MPLQELKEEVGKLSVSDRLTQTCSDRFQFSIEILQASV